MTPQKQAAQRVIDLLDDPSQDWDFLQYTTAHSSGLELWYGNLGPFEVETWPIKTGFSLWSKYRIYRAVRRAKCHALLRATSDNLTP